MQWNDPAAWLDGHAGCACLAPLAPPPPPVAAARFFCAVSSRWRDGSSKSTVWKWWSSSCSLTRPTPAPQSAPASRGRKQGTPQGRSRPSATASVNSTGCLATGRACGYIFSTWRRQHAQASGSGRWRKRRRQALQHRGAPSAVSRRCPLAASSSCFFIAFISSFRLSLMSAGDTWPKPPRTPL